MKFVFYTAICAAALASTGAKATPQQDYDAYGRPLPSVEQLCREGQMAGGPITEACARGDFRFTSKGERLTTYDFTMWGYNVFDAGVTEKDAHRLDTDATFRARYIRDHGYDRHPTATASGTAKAPQEASCREDSTFSQRIAEMRDQGATEFYALGAAAKAQGTQEKRSKMQFLIRYAYQYKDLSPSDVASRYYRTCMEAQTRTAKP